jgi:phosphate:Na+ symporter
MKDGKCSIEAGIIWSDILTDLERTSDHGSNIAGTIIDMSDHNLNMHETINNRRRYDPEFESDYTIYSDKYNLKAI